MTAESSRSWLQRVERRYAWGVVGALLGIIGLALGALSLRERRPEMSFITIGESNVMDVHTSVAALDVLYNGRSIQRSNENLKIFTVRIENTGDADVLQTHYDQGLPFGLRASAGRIVETRLIASNSDYLRRTLAPRQSSSDTVLLQKVIFDRQRYVTLQLLVLHPKQTTPAILPIGKIAGIDQFVTSKVVPSPGRAMTQDAFGGTPSRQLLRLTVYGISFTLLLGVGLAISMKFSESRRRLRRAERRQVFREIVGRGEIQKRVSGSLREIYLREGIKGLRRLEVILRDTSVLLPSLDRVEQYQVAVEEFFRKRAAEDIDYIDYPTFDPRYADVDRRVEDLVRNGAIIRRDDGTASVDDVFLQQLHDLAAELT